MASKFHKNAILTGYIDYYCLVCESYFRSEEDADIHIEKLIHKKNLGFAVYFEKLKDDHIWKVKNGYFCEFCNKLLTTTSKVGLHIAESQHNDNKGTQLLRRVGNSVITSNNIFISEKAWNGIIGETCVLCNMEFNNENIHKTEQEHILNLIMKNVEFITKTDVYRKVDKSSFQCLTCNLIFTLGNLSTHFKDEIHIKNYVECCQFNSPILLREKPEENTKKLTTSTEELTNRNTNTDSSACSKTKGVDEAKSSDTKNKVGNPNTNINSKASSTACDEKKSTKTKNNIPGKSHMDQQFNLKANNTDKSDQELKSCKHDLNNDEPEFNPPLKVKDMKKNVEKKDKTEPNKSNNKNKACKKTKILDSVTEFQRNGVNVNFENDSVFCKKCFENVDFNIVAIEKHIDEHKSKLTHQVKAEYTIGVNKNFNKTDIKRNYLDNNYNVSIQTANDVKPTENNLDKALVIYTPSSNSSKTDYQTANGTKAEIPGISQAAKVNEEPKDPGCYAKANRITYNKGNSNAYCRVCNSRVPANLRNMKEHVNGNVHKSKTAKVALEKKIIPKKRMKKFITHYSIVANRYIDDVIVNNKFCITRMSYLMITENRRCQACEVNLTEDDVDRHLESVFHERAMDNTPVMWTLHTEFVREVRPGLFHCGFCNLIVGHWEDVAIHLKCTSHLENKAIAGDRLEKHLSDIIKYRCMKARQLMYMSMGLNIGMGGWLFQ